MNCHYSKAVNLVLLYWYRPHDLLDLVNRKSNYKMSLNSGVETYDAHQSL